ncbi:extracellular solute-binding protein [Colidextribacter sp. OB.20]|uniref:extracellular solute-binding protein n=1 Tax=Colidextribacter sp. OB.20 TaxID=2304568 RepID=UPI00136E5326|nr:extracellular solute-binding protein [Colidextribacter sp. OB.20]NBI10491.1 extracellular solute-binding protein [Colidextribacter sp. OB.20]
MKRKLAFALALVLTFGLLAGCGNKNQGNQSNQGAQSNPGSASGSQKPSTPSGSDTLVVYTARSESLNNAVIENFEADTGIHVEVVTGGTGEILKRVQSEAANPQGDICWAADGPQLRGYVDYFEKYVSPEDANMMDGYKNTSGYSAPAFCDPPVFIVNNDLAAGIEVNGFEDLLNPALKGKIAAGDPVNSSSAFNCLVAGLYAMGNGDPMSDAAWEWAKGFIANLDGVSLSSSSQVYRGVAEGEYVVGLTWEDPAAAYVRDGVNVRVVFPEEGTFMSGQCVSIIKGAPNMENAKKFVDYMLGETCQSYVGQNTTVRPLNGSATLSDTLTPWADIKELDSYDGAWVADNKAQITERYTEYLVDAG